MRAVKFNQNLKGKKMNFPKAKNIVIILDPPHGSNVAGKGSPPALYPNNFPNEKHLAFREYRWNREHVLPLLKESLEKLGYEVHTTNPNDAEYLYSNGKPNLQKRVDIANAIKTDKKKLLISTHNNAVGMGNQWMNLGGNKNERFYCIFTAKGQTKSDIFAEFVYEELGKEFPEWVGITDKSDGDKDLESNFTVLMGKSYYGVLIEFGFQDVKEHVEFFLKHDTPKRYVNALLMAVNRFNDCVGE